MGWVLMLFTASTVLEFHSITTMGEGVPASERLHRWSRYFLILAAEVMTMVVLGRMLQ